MPKTDTAPKRHLNIDEKRALKAETLQHFAEQYARKAQRGKEPNDRKYARKVEKIVKRMDPEQLDSLLRDGEES